MKFTHCSIFCSINLLYVTNVVSILSYFNSQTRMSAVSEMGDVTTYAKTPKGATTAPVTQVTLCPDTTRVLVSLREVV